MIEKVTKLLNNHAVLLPLVFAAGLAMRLTLLPARWINPDEGAHLMDAKLFLDGFMPIVDFGARQPLYVFIYSVAFNFFGVSLLVGRIVPLVASMIVALFIHLISNKIFNKNVALLSAAFYLFLPLILFWSVIVKTEQVALVFVTASVYLVVVYTNARLKRGTWLTLAGICAAAAFYVRQPTLYLPMATIVYLLLFNKNKLSERFVLILQYLLGYLAVVAGFFALYLKRLSIVDILFSQLNPLNLIWNRAMHTLGLLPEKFRITDGETFRILGQNIQYTITAWEHAIFMSLFLLAAALFFILFKKYRKNEQPLLILGLWFGFVLLLYLFQSLNKGFYSQYFTEVLPPVIILASANIYFMAKKYKLNVLVAIACFVLFYFVFAVQKILWELFFGVSPLFIILTLILSIVWILLGFKGKTIYVKVLFVFSATCAPALFLFIFKLLGLNKIFAVLAGFVVLYFVLQYYLKSGDSLQVSVFIILLTTLITGAISGRFLGPSYEAVWKRQSLEKVKKILVQYSNGSDTVLSGGMIWTLEAELTPFQFIAHPTEFLKKRQTDFEEQFQQNRPAFIILDQYTEKKFQKYWLFVKQEIDQNYQLRDKVQNGNFEIKIYENQKRQLDLAPSFAKAPRSALP